MLYDHCQNGAVCRQYVHDSEVAKYELTGNLEERLREDRFMLDLEESLHSDLMSAINW